MQYQQRCQGRRFLLQVHAEGLSDELTVKLSSTHQCAFYASTGLLGRHVLYRHLALHDTLDAVQVLLMTCWPAHAHHPAHRHYGVHVLVLGSVPGLLTALRWC